MAYDVLGNITSKSGIGGYAYPTSGSASVRPHAVTAAGSTNYVYDNNGNMMTRGGSNITWYSYNLPKKIDNGSNSAEFFYGAARSRFKQIAITAAGGSLPAGTQTTLYIAGLYEQVTKPSGVIEHKHYIVAGGEAVAIRTLRSNSADDTRYLHKDHLGSVDVITSETGSVVQRLSYDAFGQRRNAAAWSGALSISDWTSIAAITHRGFTFHEELDNVDLIHMNGRVYDANIGRFISADPLIQAPLMSQSFNRYSYVINNPLSLVDPSGYSWFSKTFKKITRHVNAVVRFHFMPTPRNFFETIKSIPGQDKIDRYVMTHEWAYKVGYAAAVVSSWWIGGYGGAVYQSYYTYVATGSATEAVKVGVRAAAIQFATNYLLTGSGFNMPAPTSPGPIILYADGGAGAAGGAGLFNMFMKAYYGAPNAPDYSSGGGAGAELGGTLVLRTTTGVTFESVLSGVSATVGAWVSAPFLALWPNSIGEEWPDGYPAELLRPMYSEGNTDIGSQNPAEGVRPRGLPPEGISPPCQGPCVVGPASRPSERDKGGRSLWDPSGGEWRWAPDDKWHNPHWDYNPHAHPSSPWENIPHGGLPTHK